MEVSDDDAENDEDYENEGRQDDNLLRKIGMLCQKCVKYERIIKRLKMDLRLSRSHTRQIKCQIKINYDWDGEDANFADTVLSLVKEYLFPQYKFLKDGWMEYDKGLESLLSFVQRKVKIQKERNVRINGRG